MPLPDSTLHMKREKLRASSTLLAGHGHSHPADELERVAAYIRTHDVSSDSYGTGQALETLENTLCKLLGMDAARFMPSGCMAQPIALRIWAERAQLFDIAFHPTSHLELHEEKGYSELHGLNAHLLGEANRPTLADDLNNLPAISSLLIELPLREIGGQLPPWDELLKLVDKAKEKNIRLHLDGARLWEAQAFYQRPFTEICGLFDSVYVSFYKGIGALPGAMLLGPRDFIDEAIIWQRRQGGTLYSALPNIISAQMRLDKQIKRMHLYRKRAQDIAAIWTNEEEVEVLPKKPQVNMFHLLFTGDSETLLASRDRVAEEYGIWLISYLKKDGDKLKCEITIGESALSLSDAVLRKAIKSFLKIK